ncbi:MAG: carotenoid biosynthesis protein [Planctomycetota bacterium]
MDGLLEAAGRLLHSLLHRPYSFLPFFIFLWAAGRQFGFRRVLLLAVSGYLLAWLSEFSSIHTGFPYGRYAYLPAALEGDLLVFGVPFFDSLSYVFLAWFSWTSAELLAGGPSPAGRRSRRALFLAAGLMTWLDVVVDPVATAGDRWFLGRIHAYAAPGTWFGVPFSNFLGWFLTALAILFVWQRIDRAAGAAPPPPRRPLPGESFFGPAGYFGVAAFSIVMAFAIGEAGMALAGLFVQLPVLLWMLARAASTPARGRAPSSPPKP